MKNMDMKAWAKDVIADKKRIAIPIMTHPGIELVGKTVYEAVTDGRAHFEAIKALDERYPSAACSVIMDLTVEAEAFGAAVEFPKDDIPTVVGRLLSDHAAVENLEVPGMDAARVPQYLLANRLAAEAVDGKPVFSGMIGPFSLAGRLYDMSEFMMSCYCEPATAKLLLEKCTVFLTEYCKVLKAQGTQGVLIAEPAAGLLSDEGCSEFSSVYVKKIVEAVQDDGFMVILHNCGNTGQCTGAMVETGAAGYHFGNAINMVEALEGCPADSVVMGNIDPVVLFQSASAEELYAATLKQLEETAAFDNFVISSGCDVPPHTPHKNIEAFYAAVNDFNKTR